MEKQRQELQQQYRMATQKLERGMHEMRERLEKVKLQSENKYPKTGKLKCFIMLYFTLPTFMFNYMLEPSEPAMKVKC